LWVLLQAMSRTLLCSLHSNAHWLTYSRFDRQTQRQQNAGSPYHWAPWLNHLQWIWNFSFLAASKINYSIRVLICFVWVLPPPLASNKITWYTVGCGSSMFIRKTTTPARVQEFYQQGRQLCLCWTLTHTLLFFFIQNRRVLHLPILMLHYGTFHWHECKTSCQYRPLDKHSS